MNFGEVILNILGTFGGVAVIISAVSGWFGKILANKIMQNEIAEHNKTLENIKKEYKKEIEEYKTELNISKAKLSRYNEYQFKIYNKLWKELFELKLAANNLWENANNRNLERFSYQMRRTQDELNKNALLIEKKHYEKLKLLFEHLNNYKIGKRKLIEVKTGSESEISRQRIERLIDENKKILDNYEDLLEEIYENMRKQIH